MTYPDLIYLYWEDPKPPVSLNGKALDCVKDDVGSNPTQETNFYLFWL